ncbi:MAG: nickel pincer cofactor biosynthesis protein LarC [Planctomycetales bacterium]|nr:nickel pincer cofactor biosynthesis protein LarC [Planctomycetales bacterium]
MRIAYLDCASGVSGDMTLGALVDAGVSLDEIQAGIDSLGLPSCRLEAETVHRKGFRATKIHVRHEPEHAHRHLHHITDMIDGSQLTPSQQDLAKRIFTRLGEAEAHVHGTTIRKVHFHEVGAVDSIADIVGAAIGWDLLGVDRVVASPIPTGHGFIQIAHGRTSIPAPATAELLKGIPLAALDVEAELTTPTGAAIVAELAREFGPLPAMTIETIGYGAGDKDFATHGNVLRLLVGVGGQTPGTETRVTVMETNIDDATGELIGHCTLRLLQAGALDVFTTGIQMKKNRPATMLSVMCRPADVDRLQAIIFAELPTIGIRHHAVDRTALPRVEFTVSTTWGPVAGKLVTLPAGQSRFSPEFESCRQIAETHDVPLRDVMAAAAQAYSHVNAD